MTVKFLGIEEIEMVCQFCNKKEIGKAFTFLDLDTLNIVRFGSQCAKKALGFSTNARMGKKIRADIEATFQEDCNKAMMAGVFSREALNLLNEKKQKALDSLRLAGL